MLYLTFMIDHDVADPTGEAVFRNVRLYEDTGAESRTNYYAWGLDLSGSMQGAGTIGGLLSATLNGTNVFYSYDANGNVTGLTDTNGSNVATYVYDPFGGTVSSSGALADENPFRFSTKYWDDETGLYYYGFRYYQPETGRWPSRDPIEEDGGENLYTFVLNDPVRQTDSLGLFGRNDPPPVSFGCCDGKVYDESTHCCCGGEIKERAPKPTGLKRCCVPLAEFPYIHCFIEWPGGGTAGLYPGSPFPAGDVMSPDPNAGLAYKKCTDIELSECDCNFTALLAPERGA